MKFINPYFSPLNKIELLQKWILVHSFIYYEMNKNVVSDEMFDENCMQLVELMRNHKDLLRHSKYYKIFKHFDGSTGFYLLSKMNNDLMKQIQMQAYFVVDLNKRS